MKNWKEKRKKMWIADNGDGTYTNPILYTDYSDPDVIRVGEDYFMTASSFCNSPALPVLHSKDLVNWKVISYALDRIPYKDYETPQHGRGVWAPAIRYHEGTFFIFFPMPDEGIFCVTTKDPFKGWDKPFAVREVTGWIDPCPFWDDDGQAYMVSAFARSRIGYKNILHISPIQPDCKGVLGDGKHIFDGADWGVDTTEGPKMYKRNGYYYIFAPAGGVKTGFQIVLRSKNIYGPYEQKIVLHQGNTETNGPHQGGWVDTPDGQDWFIHFQDVGNAGRIVHLEPMKWVDDWPVIGINENEDGCGEPVITYPKPSCSAKVEIDAPEDSDDFTGETLGLQWQWNANYREDWYALRPDKGEIILYAKEKEIETQLCDVPNLLLQKWPAKEFYITTCLHAESLRDGDIAGMVSLGGVYSALAVGKKIKYKKQKSVIRNYAPATGKKEEKLFIIQRTGEWRKNNEETDILVEVEATTIFLRMKVEKETEVSFSYSLDGEQFIEVGKTVKATPGRWVGVKAGLFAVHEGNEVPGKAAFEGFFYDSINE